jgi:ATP-dependent RNA helicase DOB1
MQLANEMKEVKRKINVAVSIIQLEELKCRKRVLRRFGFIDDSDVVQLKARVACEISTGDELLLTELLFNGFFNDLTPEACAAIISCFVFEEKANAPSLKEELAKPYREIQRQARIVAKVAKESKLELVEEEYVQSFKWELVDVVYAWATGKTFAEIWYVIKLFRKCRLIQIAK